PPRARPESWETPFLVGWAATVCSGRGHPMLSPIHPARRHGRRGVDLVLAVAILACLPESSLAQTSFVTLPPGTALPTEAECAARVRRSPWEPRPANFWANNTNAYAQGWRLHGSDLDAYGYEERVTGNFTGTTDEILQWVACKWGIDEDIVRAQAVRESF